MTTPPATPFAAQRTSHTRLGFAVMAGPDGDVPEALLIGLKRAGYDAIEPNCFQAHHLPAIAERCRKVGIAIAALPTGRWLAPPAADTPYDRYAQTAWERLHEGALLASSLVVPLIIGLIRGPASVPPDVAEAFLADVMPRLVHSAPQLQILLEPIAADEAAWPHTLADGARLLERLALPNVRLLADSYHIARSGEDPNIEHYRDWIGHLHIRDHDKQIPSQSDPAWDTIYTSIGRLWRDEQLVLSFEPVIELSDTLEHAMRGARWIERLRPST